MEIDKYSLLTEITYLEEQRKNLVARNRQLMLENAYMKYMLQGLRSDWYRDIIK